MEIPIFDQLKVSNTVGIITLKSKLNLYPIFRLCTLNGIGNISYTSYHMYSRGVKLKKKKNCMRCWKNALNIEMVIGSHNIVSLKISNDIIHLTGIKSEAHAIECFELLKANLNEVENTLNYINNNMEIAKNCINYIKEITKGYPIYVIKNSDILVNPNDVIIHDNSMYVNISSNLYKQLEQKRSIIPKQAIIGEMVVPKDGGYSTYLLISVEKRISLKSINELENIPSGTSTRILKFFLDKMQDFYCYDSYILNLEWFLDIHSLYPDGNKLEYINFAYGNNNYNYNIGFAVKLINMYKLFNNTPEFITEYNKETVKYVSISLPMEIPKELKKSIRKKDNIFYHRFIIYKTGSITQSGPHHDLNKLAYDKFMKIIMDNVEMLKRE